RPGEGVDQDLPDGVEYAEQTAGEGTGAAILAARDNIDPQETVLVLSGDHPLISSDLIGDLTKEHLDAGAAATVLTTEELAIREINIGTYAFTAGDLFDALDQVGLENGERYLTGVFPVLRDRERPIAAHMTKDVLSAMGVNTRADLMTVETHLTERLIEQHAVNGVRFLSPQTTTIEADVEIGPDTVIAQGVSLHAGTRIGEGCEIGPHTTIRETTIGDRVWIAHAFMVGAEVHDEAKIGPFAYLRPGAVIRKGAKIGTYVEIKNSDIGEGAKVPHLSYLGDADVGEQTNIGASNVTANYDGRKKHRTKIGKRVKTSVDTTFVAPVSVGDDAYTGAGS